MADLPRLEQALRNAHAAGDVNAARTFASEIRRMRSAVPEGVRAGLVDQQAEMQRPSFREAQQQSAVQDRGALAASTVGGAQGITLGFGDELMAGAFTPLEMAIGAFTGEDAGKSFGERVSAGYERGLGLQRAQLGAARENHPVAAIAGEVAGAAALPGVGSRTTLGTLAQGAAAGGVYGFGSGEGGLDNRARNAAYGAGLGAGGAAVARGVGNAVATRAARRSVPSTQALADDARSLYDQSRAANVTIKAPAFDRVIQNVKLAGGRINRDLRPKTAGVVDDFEAAAGRNITLEEFDELRQVLNKSLIRAEPQDELHLARMKTIMDSFTERLGKSDITGDMAGVRYLEQARPLWARKSKSEVLEDMVERARDQATGFENGMRVQFRGLLRNPKRLKGFTKDEIDAMRRVVRGGGLENSLRAVGWLDPRGTLGAMMGGINLGTTGPATAGALAGAGYLARKGAERMTRANVAAVEDLVRSGQSTGDIVRLGRQGLGPANVGVQRAARLENRIRVPLAAIASGQITGR